MVTLFFYNHARDFFYFPDNTFIKKYFFPPISFENYYDHYDHYDQASKIKASSRS